MMRRTRYILGTLVACLLLIYAASWRTVPTAIIYGVSFSKLHAEELGLDWKETYRAVLDDMHVRHLRLSAHWTMIEPTEGNYHFDELDFQMQEAAKRGADVILAVGLRTPGWPECHTPPWALNISKAEREERQLAYMTAVINRYKDSDTLRYWQVENEVFLHFATQYCDDVDEVFLQKEIDLVHTLDPKHPVLMTDSGELGKWYEAYRKGDVFATSVYLYIWHHTWGPIRYPIRPGFFTFKENMVEWLFGTKPMILSELGAEPWLTKPIKDASIDDQLSRMNIDMFNEVISFGTHTGFSEQYLWGVEWWYYMKGHGHPEFWNRAKELYGK